jgi:hypothetical protein
LRTLKAGINVKEKGLPTPALTADHINTVIVMALRIGQQSLHPHFPPPATHWTWVCGDVLVLLWHTADVYGLTVVQNHEPFSKTETKARVAPNCINTLGQRNPSLAHMGETGLEPVAF